MMDIAKKPQATIAITMTKIYSNLPMEVVES